MVEPENLKQQQHQSDYGTIETLQTWLTQQTTDKIIRPETNKGSRTMSRWFQQVERYRHSFLQWYTNYSEQTARPAVVTGELGREGDAAISMGNGHTDSDEVTTGTYIVSAQPGESTEPPSSRTDI